MSTNDERHLQPTFGQWWSSTGQYGVLALATYGLLAFALLKGW